MPQSVSPRKWVTLALTLVLLAPSSFSFAQEAVPTPTKYEKDTARIVAMFLEQGHLSRPKIDDDVSKKWTRNYIKALDPLKYYFIKSDVDEFLKNDTALDDAVRDGNLEFARAVFARFLTRNDERYADAKELLAGPFDFTVDESLVDDPERLDYPADRAEAKDRLRKLIKYDLLRAKLAKEDQAETIKRLSMRYKDMNRYYKQFDMSEILEKYLTALTTVVDPHSSYMNGKTLEDMYNQTLHLTLDGIGASLSTEDGYAVVKEIVPGGAAEKDGRLQVDDKIVGVINENGEREDFVEKKLNDVVRKIRGKRGTKVKIVVQTADSKEEKTYELTRQKIELLEQHAKSKVIESKDEKGNAIKIGVIHLPTFYGDTTAIVNGEANAVSATRDCRQFLEDFKTQGVKCVVVDLRMNGGGLLQEAITLSGLFIDEGPVVQVREAGGVRHHDDDDEGAAWGGPLVVLIDHFSASASEIFAGVIKDYGRGLIIGDNSTFGKGTVQNILELNKHVRGFGGDKIPNLGALKLTIQQFYRANGDSTQIKGVSPDIHIPSFNDIADFGEGKSDSALHFDRVAPLPHDAYNMVPDELVGRLRERSDARRKTDEKFKEETSFLAKVAERKKRHTISLNEATFRAETRADEDADPDAKVAKDAKKKRKSRHSPQDAWESNFYNDEIMRIVTDYVELGGPRILVASPEKPVADIGERPQMP